MRTELTPTYDDIVMIPYSYYGGGTVRRKSDGRAGRLYKCDSIPDYIRAINNGHPAVELVTVQSEYTPETTRGGIIIYREPHKAYPPMHFESWEECQAHKNVKR